MYVDRGPPHLSLIVCYIFHLLIHLPCKTWFYKDCNQNCTNLVLDVIKTLGTSNQAILQPPKYLVIFVNRFRYINNNVTEDRCSIRPLCLVLKFSLPATIDHHGSSIHSGHDTASINCCKKAHSIATITQSRSSKLMIAKAPLLHMLYCMNWLTFESWTRTGGWKFDRSHGAGTSSPSHWQQVEKQAPNPVVWMMCFLLITFVPVQYNVCILCRSSVIGRIYIYSRSVQYWWSCTPSHSIGLYVWGVRGSWVECHFCFLWFTNCALLYDNSLIRGRLWPFVFVLNNILILGIWRSAIPHLAGCFCSWTSFKNIGFNMVPSDHFMPHLATQLGYSAGEFQALQLIALVAFGVVD